MNRLSDYLSPYVRIGIGADALVSWYNSFRYPLSPMFWIAQNQDGGAVLWVMGAIGIVLILDALMNDMTPDKITIGGKTMVINWKHVFRKRHVVIMALAACYAVHPYLAARAGYPISSPLTFYKQAFFVAGIAVFDARIRMRSIGWQRVFS